MYEGCTSKNEQDMQEDWTRVDKSGYNSNYYFLKIGLKKKR